MMCMNILSEMQLEMRTVLEDNILLAVSRCS